MGINSKGIVPIGNRRNLSILQLANISAGISDGRVEFSIQSINVMRGSIFTPPISQRIVLIIMMTSSLTSFFCNVSLQFYFQDIPTIVILVGSLGNLSSCGSLSGMADELSLVIPGIGLQTVLFSQFC